MFATFIWKLKIESMNSLDWIDSKSISWQISLKILILGSNKYLPKARIKSSKIIYIYLGQKHTLASAKNSS